MRKMMLLALMAMMAMALYAPAALAQDDGYDDDVDDGGAVGAPAQVDDDFDGDGLDDDADDDGYDDDSAAPLPATGGPELLPLGGLLLLGAGTMALLGAVMLRKRAGADRR